MKGGDELSLKDITFLRAIRDINGSPERYSSTDAGVTPATVTAITEATTLSQQEVAYRLDHPRLGKSGLVKVYQAGLPGDDSAGLNSAKLTEAGEAVLADAEERQASVDAQEWQPEDSQSEFDNVQEWEPAEVESSGAAAPASVTPGEGGSIERSGGGSVTESPAISEPATRATAATSGTIQTETTSSIDGTVEVEEERLNVLESRLDDLEAAQTESEPASTPAEAADAEQVEALHEEVRALRETNEQLEDELQTALSTVEDLQESDYGALDEKREEQFQTAVKSMVAFHQLATEVLDVRVENYEPAAGYPESERVEISRSRIGDALGIGQSDGGGSSGMSLSGGDSQWPSAEGGASGRVFGDDDEADESAEEEEPGEDIEEEGEEAPTEPQTEPEPESDAPETGVYPPLGGGDEGSSEDAAEAETEPEIEAESDAPESGVYPPLGQSGGEDEEDGMDEKEEDEADPVTVAEDTAAEEPAEPAQAETGPADLGVDVEVPETANIRESASEDGHVMEAIRTTAERDPPLSVDGEELRAVREAVANASESATTEPTAVEAEESEQVADRRLPMLDTETVAQVWQATTAAGDASGSDTALATRSKLSKLPAVRADAAKLASIPLADGEGGPGEHCSSSDDA